MKLRIALALVAAMIPVSQAASVGLSDEKLDILANDSLRYPVSDTELGTLESLISVDGSRLANSLWSSSQVVKSFVRGAVSQLDVHKGTWRESNPAAASGKGGMLSTEHTSKSNIWVGGQGNWGQMSTSSDISGYKYNGGGYAFGMDHACTKNFTGGLAFGESFGTNKAKLGFSDIDQRTMMVGTYGRYKTDVCPWHSILIDGYFAYGSTRNKEQMTFAGMPDLPANSKWNDDIYTAGLTFSWEFKATENSMLIPFVGIDYMYGSQDNITLNSERGSRSYSDGDMQVWTVPVGITYRAICPVGGQQFLVPEITLAYEGDVSRTNPSVKTDVLGNSMKIEGSRPGRSALLVNTGMRWIMDRNWSLGAYYTFEGRSHMTDHAVNGSINYTF